MTGCTQNALGTTDNARLKSEIIKVSKVLCIGQFLRLLSLFLFLLLEIFVF